MRSIVFLVLSVLLLFSTPSYAIKNTAGSAIVFSGLQSQSGANLTLFGDSITYGQGASPIGSSYASLLTSYLNIATVNWGIPSFYACDMTTTKVFYYINPGLTRPAFYTMMIGTNEAAFKGVGAYEAVYRDCHKAALSWLGVPVEYKSLTVYSPNCSHAGTWTVDSNANATIWPGGIALMSTTNGSTATCTITTTGRPIYAWFRQNDTWAGTFTYAVDGGTPVSVNSFTTPATATSCCTGGGNVIRIPDLAAGSHSVVFTVTSATGASNVVDILGIGTPAPDGVNPKQAVYAAGVPREQNDANALSVAQYDKDAQADIALLASDGLPIRFVNVQQYLNTTTDMTDSLHPNNAGHAHLEQAWAAAIILSR